MGQPNRTILLLRQPRFRRPGVLLALLLSVVGVIGGCSLEPKTETQAQRDAITAAGANYEKPFDRRTLPPLPDRPTWRQVLQRSFLSNGDLEAAYFEWKASLARVPAAGAYPNANLQLNYSYLFSSGEMKSWDRTTLGIGFDPSMTLQWPEKVRTAAKIALEDTRARGERFRAAKFSLQQKVLTAFIDYAGQNQRVGIQQENVDLLKMLQQNAAQRVRVGGPQQDLLKAQNDYELARNDLANMQSELNTMRAMLNGLLGRSGDAALLPPAGIGTEPDMLEPRTIPPTADDGKLIAAAVAQNPELAALAHDVQGRSDALELARMAYIPDISPQFSITGSISQMAGAMATLPTNLVKIKGSIQEAKALVSSSVATARQTRADRAATFIATLYALRNNERQLEVLETLILPKTRQVLASSQKSYMSGLVGFADLIDSQRTLLDVRNLILDAHIAREKRLAELEALAGVDIETLLMPPTTTTAPATEEMQNAKLKMQK
ncbi:MAG: TolC family protein [Phycisphaerae bacterium]